MTAMENGQTSKVYLAMHEKCNADGYELKEVDAAYTTFDDAMQHSSLGYVNAQAEYMKDGANFKYDDNNLTIEKGHGCSEGFYVEEHEVQCRF